MNHYHLLAILAIAPLISIDAFSSSWSHPCRGTSLRSTPGDWTNDDFLNSLGGGDDENSGNSNDSSPPQQQQVPQNDLTDDEITEMALRAAQFYNTDTTVQEAYGVRREGPPRRKDE
jgi:hypothetical protein